MKRIGDLYDKVISLDNLRLADAVARRGKRGRKQRPLSEAQLLDLHALLLTQSYRTSPYRHKTVYEPKVRLISYLPYFPDCVVQQAIINVAGPIWKRTFTHNTYSCIKGRGIDGCADQVSRIIRRYDGRPLYCLKIDLRKYYPSVDHETMKSIVRRRIKDARLLWLIDSIVDSADGLPIGNHLSQYLANLLPAYFMHMVNERLHLDAVEYADDFCFFADSKERLREAWPTIRAALEQGLRLTVKPDWQIFPIAANRADRHGRALDFIGYRFYRRQRLLRKRIKQNLARRIARLNRRQPPLTAKAYKQQVAPWLGWAQHSNSKHLLKTLIPKEYENVL